MPDYLQYVIPLGILNKIFYLPFMLQIDAVAKSRDGKFRIGSNDEREQTLNQLLTVSLLSCTFPV